eukprot:305740-Rhodomonas_salina.5
MAVWGTELACGATPCGVLSSRTVLPGSIVHSCKAERKVLGRCYAMSGTDIAHRYYQASAKGQRSQVTFLCSYA